MRAEGAGRGREADWPGAANGQAEGNTAMRTTKRPSFKMLSVLAPATAPSIDTTIDSTYDHRPTFEQRVARVVARRAKKAAQRLMRSAFGAIGYVTRYDRPRLPLLPGDPRIRRILLVRVDLLGDTVLLTAAVRALRRGYPRAHIDVLVLPSTAGVLAGDPDIHAILTWDPLALVDLAKVRQLATWRDAWQCLRRLRSAQYDLAISVCGDAASIVTRLSGAHRRVGYALEAYPHLLTDPVPGGRYREPKHEVRYVLELAEVAGGRVTPEDAQPWLRVPPEERSRMAALLDAARASSGVRGPIVAIHPGARNGSAKRWPLRSYAALADRLVNDLDALVVLTGSPNEAPLAHAVCNHVHVPVVDLTGETMLPELVALLAESDVVVTGDSGPMHIACAVRTPVVALHGPTDPGQSGPTSPDALVLRHNLACSPCYDSSATAECRFGNPVCMKQITPGMVFAAVRSQLARHSRPATTTPKPAKPTAVSLP